MKTIITMKTTDLTKQTGVSVSDMSPEHAAALLLDAFNAAQRKPVPVHTKMIPVDQWRAAFTASNGQRFIVHGDKVRVCLSVA